MARFARRNVRRTVKRRTKWCGSSDNSAVPSTTANVVTDATPLCQPTTAVIDQADPVVGWCRGAISLSRVNFADTTPSIMWAIVVGRTEPGAVLPLQVFNPFDEGDLERQDILGMGMLVCPPVLLIPSTDAQTSNNQSTVTEINIKVGRKLMRNTNNLFLWIVADAINDAFQAQSVVRTLMKF